MLVRSVNSAGGVEKCDSLDCGCGPVRSGSGPGVIDDCCLWNSGRFNGEPGTRSGGV